MFPDDPVLVGVLNRRRDFERLRDELWYRVPIFSAPLCVDALYVAFYLSARLTARRVTESSHGHAGQPVYTGGAIVYYARLTGFELARRRDLLPEEVHHPRAENLYFKLQFRSLERKSPPITNPTCRPVSFIYTTWERFTNAQTITALYKTNATSPRSDHVQPHPVA